MQSAFNAHADTGARDSLATSFAATYAGVLAFIAVVHAGSFATAAARLGIGRSAVSRSILKLEAQIDARLFARTTRTMTLTSAGHLFYAHCKPGVDGIVHAVEQMRGLRGNAAGAALRVAAAAEFGHTVLAPLVADFRAHYPDIAVDLLCDDRPVDWSGDRIDVAFRGRALCYPRCQHLPIRVRVFVDYMTHALRARDQDPSNESRHFSQPRKQNMKIVIIGGTGLIGSKLVAILRARGHDALAASPNSGVNTLTGEGLDAALAGADIVVDVANSPSFADDAVLAFFTTSGQNLLAAEKKANVKHHVALSVVGTDRLAASGYFRGKIAQEKLIREAGLPYTIVHSTQFFEFLGGIVASAAAGDTIALSPAYIQAISSDDVAAAMADFTLGAPVNGVVEIGGPEKVRMSDLVQHYLNFKHDPRTIVANPDTPYFGATLQDDTLIPGAGARLGAITVDAWLATQAT